MTHYLDKLMVNGDINSELANLKPQIDEINDFPVVERIQQELSPKTGLKYLNAARMWLRK